MKHGSVLRSRDSTGCSCSRVERSTHSWLAVMVPLLSCAPAHGRPLGLHAWLLGRTGLCTMSKQSCVAAAAATMHITAAAECRLGHRPEGVGELLLPLFCPFPFPNEPTPLPFPLLLPAFPLPLKLPFPAPMLPAPFPWPLFAPVFPWPFCTPFTGGGATGGLLPPPPPPPVPPFPGNPCGVFVSRPRAFPTLLSIRL